MAVPTYPSSISMNDIKTEFSGGSDPAGIDEYYSGGSYVPTGTANSTGTTIPTTGLITYLNFSGAIKITNIGWWQFRYQPNTSHAGYGSIDDQASSIKFLRTTANTNTFVTFRYTTNAYISWISAESGASATTKDFKGPMSSQTPYSIDVANDDSHILTWASFSPTTNAMARLSPSGDVIWSVNANASISTAVAVNGNVIAIHKRASNCMISKISISDGTTRHWTFSPCTTTAIVASGRHLYVTSNEQIAIWTSASTAGSVQLYQLFIANGTVYSANSSIRGLGALFTDGTTRTDPSGNLYFRGNYGGTVRDFGSMAVAKRPPTWNWLKTLPLGNTIYCHASDEASNTYVSYSDGISNTYLVKVDAAGNISWQRKIRSTRTGGSGVFRPRVTRLIAKPDQFIAQIAVDEMVFNTKWGNWDQSTSPEVHLLRLPSNGSNTGTYANLIYESTTAVSYTAQTNPSWSSISTTDYAAVPSLTANTFTLTTNTARNIQGTAI